MNIVYLDNFVLHLSEEKYAPLKDLGSVTLYDRTPRELIVERAKDAEIILTNKVVLDAEILADLPRLKYIGVTATGYNIIDIAAAKARGIIVTNAPEYGTASVAQAVFALLLELANNTSHYTRAVHDGRWASSPDFCFIDKPIIELAGLNLGIIGMGNIGAAVAQIAMAFGMRVMAHVRTPRTLPHGVEAHSLDDIFRHADAITLHCPLTAETRHLVNTPRLNLMKRSAFIINTARGDLVKEDDLAKALNEDRIAGAALDVLSTEPPKADNPLLSAKNCIITPHVAWASHEARVRLLEIVIENIRAYQGGKPANVVN